MVIILSQKMFIKPFKILAMSTIGLFQIQKLIVLQVTIDYNVLRSKIIWKCYYKRDHILRVQGSKFLMITSLKVFLSSRRYISIHSTFANHLIMGDLGNARVLLCNTNVSQAWKLLKKSQVHNLAFKTMFAQIIVIFASATLVLGFMLLAIHK